MRKGSWSGKCFLLSHKLCSDIWTRWDWLGRTNHIPGIHELYSNQKHQTDVLSGILPTRVIPYSRAPSLQNVDHRHETGPQLVVLSRFKLDHDLWSGSCLPPCALASGKTLDPGKSWPLDAFPWIHCTLLHYRSVDSRVDEASLICIWLSGPKKE